MRLGPLFRAELTRASRHRRTFAVRTGFGLVLLLALLTAATPRELWGRQDPARQGGIAGLFLYRVATLQLIAAAVVVPGLVAGAVAEQDRRRTMLDLLTTRLSSAEIVLGLLAGRLAMLVGALLVGLPVAAIVACYGGIDPLLVATLYGAIASTALVLGSAALLFSVLFRRPRGALMSAYLFMSCWLLGLWLAEDVASNSGGPIAEGVVLPVTRSLMKAHPAPLWLWFREWAGMALYRPEQQAWMRPTIWLRLRDLLPWYFGGQAAAIVLSLGLSIGLLRPLRVGRRGRRMGPRAAAAPIRRRVERRAPDRPPVGDRPMRWKERYASGSAGHLSSRWGVVIMATLTFCVFLDPARDAFREFVGLDPGDSARVELNGWLRDVQSLVVGGWLVAAASVGAGSIAGEREQGTWESVRATLLTGREVIGAKVLGALWATRGLAVPLVMIWLIGLGTGSVHPLGVPASAAVIAACLPFAAAAGVACSVRASSGSRAFWASLAAVLVGNLVAVSPFLGAGLDPTTAAGVGPALAWEALLARDEPARLGAVPAGDLGVLGLMAAAPLVLYPLATRGLIAWTARRYEEGPGRPRSADPATAGPRPPGVLQGRVGST